MQVLVRVVVAKTEIVDLDRTSVNHGGDARRVGQVEGQVELSGEVRFDLVVLEGLQAEQAIRTGAFSSNAKV